MQTDPLSGPLADALIVTALALSALTATAVVLTRSTVRQAIVLSGFGMMLGLLFLVLQAPGAAMSELAIQTVLVPLMVVLALHATRRYRDGGGEAAPAGGGDEGERSPGAGVTGDDGGGTGGDRPDADARRQDGPGEDGPGEDGAGEDGAGEDGAGGRRGARP